MNHQQNSKGSQSSWNLRGADAETRKNNQVNAGALWRITANDIVYEDEVLIAINKPAGIPSQATLDPNRDNCYAAVQRYLERKSDHAYVGLHHRLDAMTSGVLLMTKSKDVNVSVSEQFQQHVIRKKYCAICVTKPGNDWDVRLDQDWFDGKKSFVLDAPIGEIPDVKNQKFCVGGKKRKPAQTEFFCETCLCFDTERLVVCQCMPLTGRTHQIRVHLPSLGLGIVGDVVYGFGLPRYLRSMDPRRMCLHAESLRFVHPVSGEEMTICAPRPVEFQTFVKKAGKLKASGAK